MRLVWTTSHFQLRDVRVDVRTPDSGGAAHTDDSRVLEGFSARVPTSGFIPHFRFSDVQTLTFKRKGRMQDVGRIRPECLNHREIKRQFMASPHRRKQPTWQPMCLPPIINGNQHGTTAREEGKGWKKGWSSPLASLSYHSVSVSVGICARLSCQLSEQWSLSAASAVMPPWPSRVFPEKCANISEQQSLGCTQIRAPARPPHCLPTDPRRTGTRPGES